MIFGGAPRANIATMSIFSNAGFIPDGVSVSAVVVLSSVEKLVY
jgi:hypothetical protein